MKKILLPVLGLSLMTSTAFAQVFSEDFGSGIPSTWTVIDNDGFTPDASQTGILAGWNGTSDTNGEYAENTSFYNPINTADDWLITPAIAIPTSTTNGHVLKFNAVSLDADYLSSIKVNVSTSGSAISDFTSISTKIIASGLNTYSVDLTAYQGQTIYIALQDVSVDKFRVRMDDVEIVETEDNDAELSTVTVDGALVGNRTLTFTVKNVGANDITSYDINWSYDGNDYTEAVTGINIGIGESNATDISLSVPTPVENGAFSAEVVNVNGGVDPDITNNAVSGTLSFLEPVPNFTLTDSHGNSYDLHEELAAGKSVVLDFFASWCTPCANSTPALNQFYVDNGAGANDLQVFGMTVYAPDNTDAIMNGLGWGGTYPKFKYNDINNTLYSHFANGYGLNPDGSIPFFVMICPNELNPGFSEIITSTVGFDPNANPNIFDLEFEPAIAACALDIEETVVANEVSAYPNPASNLTNIRFALNTNANVSMTMVDMLGKVVYTTENTSYDAGNHTISVDVSNLEKGMYMSTLTIDGAAHSVKITVE